MIQVVKRTFEERVKTYMKLSKQELAMMLAERDRVFDAYFEPEPLKAVDIKGEPNVYSGIVGSIKGK